MVRTLPPGVSWFAGFVVSLCIPAATLYVLIRLLEIFLPFALPRIAVAICAPLAFPVKAIALFWLGEVQVRREASAFGARRVPRAPGRWFGNLDVLVRESANMKSGLGYITSSTWRELGSPFNFWLLWDNTICTSDPEHMKTILSSQFNNYPKGEHFRHAMATILGTGVFNSDGDMWKHHRSITRPFFSKDRVAHFETFDRHAADSIERIKVRMRAGYAVDFQDLALRFTFDAATEFLFGACAHTLSAGLPYPHSAPAAVRTRTPPNASDAVADAFADAQRVARDRCLVLGFWPMFEIFKDRADAPMRTVNAFVDPILRRAVERKRVEDLRAATAGEKATCGVKDDDTFLGHLLRHGTDAAELRTEMLNMLAAGRDTTASLLASVVYVLAMYPSILARARAEILAHVGPASAPTCEDIRNMKYLRALLNETLRLYPPGPMNVRQCVDGATWPVPRRDLDTRPYHIPAGSHVIFAIWEMHRRKDLWGEDADEFDPDRFIDERKNYLLANPYIFLPFNAGPRICIGQQFAYNEVSFMIIRLLQAFSDITLDSSAVPPGSAPPAEWANSGDRRAKERCFVRSSLTLSYDGGVWVKMTEAEST